MVYFVPPNCQHLDNWGRCKLHKAHWALRWIMPKGRPPCVIQQQRAFLDQDEEPGCKDQKPLDRPRPPGPMPMARNA